MNSGKVSRTWRQRSAARPSAGARYATCSGTCSCRRRSRWTSAGGASPCTIFRCAQKKTLSACPAATTQYTRVQRSQNTNTSLCVPHTDIILHCLVCAPVVGCWSLRGGFLGARARACTIIVPYRHIHLARLAASCWPRTPPRRRRPRRVPQARRRRGGGQMRGGEQSCRVERHGRRHVVVVLLL